MNFSLRLKTSIHVHVHVSLKTSFSLGQDSPGGGDIFQEIRILCLIRILGVAVLERFDFEVACIVDHWSHRGNVRGGCWSRSYRHEAEGRRGVGSGLSWTA
jgi:hypothetical protein